MFTYQVQYRHFHHTLVEVCGPVLDDLDSDYFLCLQVLTFDNLAERSLTQHIQNEVSVLVPRLFRSQYVVDVENVIAILVVIPIVLDSFARFGEDSTRVACGLVVEAIIA